MLAAGTYQGRAGSGAYAHNTGGSMTGREVRHRMMGNALAAVGMHMGGTRLGSVGALETWQTSGRPPFVPPELLMKTNALSGLGKGRAFRLGAYERWGRLGPGGEPAMSLQGYERWAPLGPSGDPQLSLNGGLGAWETWGPLGPSGDPRMSLQGRAPWRQYSGGRTLSLGRVVLGGVALLGLAALA